jgi:hypothetical protein
MKAVFTCGRFNPPTVGHQKMVERMRLVSEGGEIFIFTTSTVDRIRNPLTAERKVAFLSALFPDAVVASAKNAFAAGEYLRDLGFDDVSFVCGEDRAAMGSGLIKYDLAKRISVVARGLDAVSATRVRAAASAGAFSDFAAMLPTRDRALARRIYDDVRSGMGGS